MVVNLRFYFHNSKRISSKQLAIYHLNTIKLDFTLYCVRMKLIEYEGYFGNIEEIYIYIYIYIYI